MSRIVIFCLLFLCLPAAPTLAQAPCAPAEFLSIFKLMAERQLELDTALDSVDDLLSFSESAIAERRNGLSSLPFCADALTYQRLSIEVTGDFIARQALNLAYVPQGDNPYRLRFASEQERIENSLTDMLSLDRSDAPAAEERSLPECGSAELAALDELVAELLSMLENNEAGADLVNALPAIDARLLWREENLQNRPACAEWIELLPALSAAATDSATAQAMATVVESAANPFARLTAGHIIRLRHWQAPTEAAHSVPSGATIASSGLPACSFDELAQAFAILSPQYATLRESAANVSDISSLQRYSEAYLHYRSAQLVELPLCAEAFAIGWEARQVLGGLAARAALDLAHAANARSPLQETLPNDSARLALAIDGLASRLEAIGGLSMRESAASLLPCGRIEISFLHHYLLPRFDEFSLAALSLRTPQGLPLLIERSLDLRDLLWLELPRCAETLEAGLVMRRIAADLVALIGLEAAGIPALDSPYIHSIAADMAWLAGRLDQLTGDTGSAARRGARYYIIAESGANIRSCASTDCEIVATALAGEAVYADDDSGAWYRLNLPDQQTGYIASFLVSKTAPDS